MKKADKKTIKVTPEKEPDKQSGEAAVARVPWNPWLGVGFIVVLFWGALYFIGPLLISVYPLVLRHWSVTQANNWLQTVPAQFMYLVVVDVVVLGGIYAFLRCFNVGFRILGLRWPRPRDALYAVLIWAVYFVVLAVAVKVVGTLVPSFNANQKQDIGFTNVHGTMQLVLTYISLAVLPPFTEEIVFRGFLYGTLKKGVPTAVAVILTSLMFAAGHLTEGGGAGPLYVAALDTFLLSLALIYLREKTRGLAAGMLVHALKNSLAFAALFVLNMR